MELYTPVLALVILATGFAVVTLIMSAVVGPKRYNRAKLESYECGIDPTPHAAGGGRFPVKYYITAMLFIVFDIEIIFLYPWAVHFDAMAFFGLIEMVLFIATVFVAYAYVWRRGGLDWD
ncbi:NADH-quinone oxidoreductase subunit A [Nocardioides pacificus]